MRWLVMFLAMPLLGLAQDQQGFVQQDPKFEYYLHQFVGAERASSEVPHEFSAFVERLEAKKETFRNEHDFLKHLFTKTHQKFLVQYNANASFQELLKSGNYSCLTGTALYALLLDHFKADYRVVETNYHIFILVNTEEGQVLLEATDPARGFVDNTEEVEERISRYRKNELPTASADKAYYRYSFDLFDEVNLDQMLGLLQYNLSIVDYNTQKLQEAIAHLDKAMELYPSPRMDEFAKILLLTIHESQLGVAEKESLIRKIQSMRKKKMASMASARAN